MISPRKDKSATGNLDTTQKPTEFMNEPETLAPPEHAPYKENYWLTADDIIFILTAFLGDVGVYAPTPYDVLVKSLGASVAKHKGRSAPNRNKLNRRWGKWTLQVTNCGSSKTKGVHWILTATLFDAKPQAVVWEPLATKGMSEHVVKALSDICGVVPFHIMHQQSCG